VPSGQCKQLALPSPARRRHALATTLLTGVVGLANLSACDLRPHARTITVRALETAAAVTPHATRRAILSDRRELDDLYCPLNQRLGLLQVRSAKGWEALRRCAPELGPAPDFSRGIVIGLASHAGLPLNGTWPIHLETIRVHEGAGFVIARFEGGSFLPDGTTYLETAHVEGLAAVLMLEVDGTRFYPK